MFKNVLVGVDGRPSGRDAIALASHSSTPDGTLTLAHVHSGPLLALARHQPWRRQSRTPRIARAARAGAYLRAT